MFHYKWKARTSGMEYKIQGLFATFTISVNLTSEFYFSKKNNLETNCFTIEK